MRHFLVDLSKLGALEFLDSFFFGGGGSYCFLALLSFAPLGLEITTVCQPRADGSIIGSRAKIISPCSSEQGAGCQWVQENVGNSRPHYSPPSQVCLPVKGLKWSRKGLWRLSPMRSHYSVFIPGRGAGRPNKWQDEPERIRLG